MPNLLSINNYHYKKGGAEIVYFGHAKLFESHGWGSHFFSMKHPENIASADSAYFVDMIEYGQKIGVVDRLKQAAEIIYSAQAKANIESLLDATPIDVAHVHNIYHHISPSVLVALKSRGIPTVLTAHDLKIVCPAYKMMNSGGICERCKGGKLWNVVAQKCIKENYLASVLVLVESSIHQSMKVYERNVDYIIAPSLFYKTKLIEWGVSADKLVHIPNFIENVELAETPAPQDYVVYFGRLAHEKGIGTLIRAAAKSGTRVKIVGTGPEGDALKQLAMDLNAPVEFMGYQTGDALWAIVDGARANVLPSEWYENGPMSAIEALARGKPMIGADIGGIPEMIQPGRTGWVFPSGDVDALAGALEKVRLMPDAELLAIGEQCQAYTRAEHSPEVYYERVQGLYDKIRRRP